MGKYSVGQRVTDPDGDLCEIIGKPSKGMRQVRYNGGKLDGMLLDWSKGSLQPANDNPSISAETSESAYFAGGGRTVIAWTPAVGERVLAVGRGYGDTKDFGVIRDLTGDPVGGAFVEFNDGWSDGHGGMQDDAAKNRWYFNLTSLSPAPLVIEAGKFYRTRDGRKVGPARTDRFNIGSDDQGRTAAFYFATLGDVTTDGIWLTGNGNANCDLVAEWVEPAPVVAVAEATATRKFNVGDRVNYVYEGRQQTSWQGVEITKDDGKLYYATCPTHGEGAFYEDWLEPAAPPAKFKVGDRVRYTGKSYDRSCFGTVARIEGDKVHCSDWSEGHPTGWMYEENLALVVAPSIPIGSTVTFTATGRLSAYTTDGHAQIVFPGLTPGQNSFALPSKFVALAN